MRFSEKSKNQSNTVLNNSQKSRGLSIQMNLPAGTPLLRKIVGRSGVVVAKMVHLPYFLLCA